MLQNLAYASAGWKLPCFNYQYTFMCILYEEISEVVAAVEFFGHVREQVQNISI
jgi:hypothetical protein